MQYFVSIENIPYFHWQTELLIESFLQKGIEDQLCIAIAGNDKPAIAHFTHNLKNHKLKFLHTEKDYKPLNKIYSLLMAIDSKIIEPPFAIIHPDMVLINSIDPEKYDCDIVFDVPYDIADIEEQNALRVKLYGEEVKSILPENMMWIPIGDIVVVKKADLDFFKRIAIKMEELKDQDLDTDKAAWIMTLHQYLGAMNFKGAYFQIPLIHSELNSNFVHYKHGLPPVFNKRFFRFDPETFGFIMGSQDPYEALLEHNPTRVTNYVQEIIRSYKQRLKLCC